MKIMKKALGVSLATVLGLSSTVANISAAEKKEVKFDLNAEVFDYGEAINQVILDPIKTLDTTSLAGLQIDESSLAKDTFTIKASSTNPYDLGENPSYGLYTDVERTIANVSVNGEGKIVIDLECAYNGAGQGTLNYVGGDVARNLSMDISYEIIQNKDYKLTNDTIITKDEHTFKQGVIISDEITQFTSASSNELNYQYYTPSNANDGNKHPLIIWFHGNGEGGYNDAQNNDSQLRANRGALGFTEKASQDIFGGAYVLAPQAPDTWYNNYTNDYIGKATKMIEEFATNNNVDTNRIYVFGCSAGGYMTTRMAMENLNLFAAVVPTCPAIDVAPARGGVVTTDKEIKTLIDQNIWLVHAKNDTTVIADDASGRMAGLLENAIYTPYETVNVDGVEYPGHWSWIYTARNMPSFNGTSLYDWVAAQKLVQAVTPPVEEEKPETPSVDETVTVPNTGDYQYIAMYTCVALVSIATIGYIFVKRRKENA